MPKSSRVPSQRAERKGKAPASGANTSPYDVIEAEFVAGATRSTDLPAPTFVEVAFAGRSNVGKSSLLNAMVQRRSLVRTSSTPGCTRQINVFRAALRTGHVLHLVDLPGYGYARVSKAERGSWGPLIERYLLERTQLRVLVLLVDVRRGLEDDDRGLVQFLGEAGPTDAPAPEVIVVATKLDKLPVSRQKVAVAALKRAYGVEVVGFSAVTGAGRDVLWKKILGSLVEPPRASEPG